MRQDWLHETSTREVRELSLIGIEDLNVRGLLANDKRAEDRRHRLLRIPPTVGVQSEAERGGAELVIASRWFASSKMCSVCGPIAEGLPHPCGCGDVRAVHDREINGAANLRQ